MRFLLLVYVGFFYGKKGTSTRWYVRACFFVLQQPNSNTGLVFTYIRTHSCLIISGNEQQSNNNIFFALRKTFIEKSKS